MIHSYLSGLYGSTPIQRDQRSINIESRGRMWNMIRYITDTISYIFTQAINNLSLLFKNGRSLTSKSISDLHPLVQSGIHNDSNCCYLNSVIQALSTLSITSEYEEINTLPELEKSKTNEIRTKIKNLFDKISLKQTVNSAEINAFKNLLRDSGFPAGSNSPEDAEQLCSFLLNELHVKPTTYILNTVHEAPVPIPHLDMPSIEHVPMLQLKYETVDKDSSIQQLLYASTYNEELDSESLKKILPDVCGEKLTLLVHGSKSFPALRNICLQPEKIPKLLPIHLSRFTYHRGALRKKLDTIFPNEEILLPIDGSTKSASYTLSAVVIHKGVSAHSGHYYCYIPKIIDEKKVWIRLDDATVTAEEPADCIKDAAENGYLFFYSLKN